MSNETPPLESHALTSDWLTWAGLAVDVAGKVDWVNALMIFGGFAALALLMIAQFKRGDGFDLRSLVARRAFIQGREYWTVDPGKMWQAGGFMFTSWGFVALVGKGLLSDLYLMIYAVAWLGAPAINQIVASKYPVAPGTNIIPPAPPAEDSSSVVTTTTTEIKK